MRCLVRVLLILALPAVADELVDPSAAVLAEGWKHKVWLVNPPEKLQATEPLSTDRTVDAIRISAARGEAEPVLLVVRSDVPLRDVKLTPADLNGPGDAKLAASQVDSRRLAYVYVDEPSGTNIPYPMMFRTGTGLYPDPLVPGSGVARPNHNLQFWVTLNVPREAAPGEYTGTWKLTWRWEGWMPKGVNPVTHELPVAVKVRTFALPSPSPLRNTAFFSPHRLTGERQDPEYLTNLYRDFVAHRQTPEPILPSPQLRVVDGKLQIDTTKWEAAATVLFDELRVSHLFIPVWASGTTPAPCQGIYFLWHYPLTTKQRWLGAFIVNEQRELTPEFKALFGAYLKHMAEVLKRHGWLDRAYLTTMDEPYTYHVAGADRQGDTPENNYQIIANYVNLVREVAPGIKTWCTADPTPGLNGLIDQWCLRNLQHAAEARQRVTEHGEELIYCDNYRTFIDYPLVSARTLGWLAWKIGARGWLTYETMGNFETAWEGPVVVYPNFLGVTVWGLGQMLYPDPLGPGYFGSLRWEMMREGAEDYEYLWLLKQKLDALSADQQDNEPAKAARQLLETAATQIVGGSGEADPEALKEHPNAQSNALAVKLREQVAAAIEELP